MICTNTVRKIHKDIQIIYWYLLYVMWIYFVYWFAYLFWLIKTNKFKKECCIARRIEMISKSNIELCFYAMYRNWINNSNKQHLCPCFEWNGSSHDATTYVKFFPWQGVNSRKHSRSKQKLVVFLVELHCDAGHWHKRSSVQATTKFHRPWKEKERAISIFFSSWPFKA